MILESLLNYVVILVSSITISALILSNNIMKIILLNSVFSTLAVIMYLILDAPDVAITEGCVGVLSSIFSIFTLNKIYKNDFKIADKFNPTLFMIIMTITLLLLFTTQGLPEFGQTKPDNYYLNNSYNEIGITSIVTSILASYRGYDTMLETLVIMLGSLAVLLIKPQIKLFSIPIKDLIAEKFVSFIFALLLLFAFYLQFHGEISPGGGFQAGTIIAASFILYGIVFGNHNLIKFVSLPKLIVLSVAGIGIYLITGLISILRGKSLLNYNILSNNSLIGQSIGINAVEIGIGISVAASMLIIYLSLSDESST